MGGWVRGDLACHILGLHGWVALAIVFVVPMLELSAFVGFVFPGEIALLLGGMLAFQHCMSLTGVVIAAVSGAILGDTVGYAVGRRYGQRLPRGTLGRFVKRKHLDRGERYLATRGGKAAFFSRFTPALRVLIPALAGMARMPYRTFAVYNIVGGTVWATGVVLLGYFAGASWRRAEHLASRVSLLMLAFFVLGVGLWLGVWALGRHSQWLHALGDRLASTRPAVWARHRFPTQLTWLAGRLNPHLPTGLALTVTLSVAGLGTWAFVGLTQDVLTREEAASLDPRVQAFAVAHRTGWLSGSLQTITWLGSNVVLIPLLVAISVSWLRTRRNWRIIVQLWIGLLGATLLYAVIKNLIERPRPPVAELIGHTTGWSYPSGHATQAIAAWGMLAILLGRGRALHTRLLLAAAAVITAALVGISRIYLGAHWLTDVLAGYALGVTWLALVLALLKAEARPEGP